MQQRLKMMPMLMRQVNKAEKTRLYSPGGPARFAQCGQGWLGSVQVFITYLLIMRYLSLLQ